MKRRTPSGWGRSNGPASTSTSSSTSIAVAAPDRAGGKPFDACRAHLGGAGFQHPVAPSERPERRHSLSPEHRCVAPVDRHRARVRHGFEDQGEGGSKPRAKASGSARETWGFQASARAQGSLGDRRGHAGDQGNRGDRQSGRPLSADCFAIACRATDAPMLPGLLNQAPADQAIGKVSAPSRGLPANHCRATDGAHDTRGCHAAIAARSACAVIPARKNARLWLETTPGAEARNETDRATRRLGRTIWRRWSGYHRRSLVEIGGGPENDPGDRFPGD